MKIFEIGKEKTGTTSLGTAAEILGFRPKGWDSLLHAQCSSKNYEKTYQTIKNFNFFVDMPWSGLLKMYKKFDGWFPESKFILLERDEDEWKESYRLHLIRLYKRDNDRQIFFIDKKIKEFEIHYREIKEYFKDRPNDLLIMNICKGEGWEKLCNFLKCEIPKTPFPHENKKPKNKL